MNKAHKPDYILFGVIVILCVLGILALASVSGSVSVKKFGTPYYYLSHQLIYGFLPGIVLFILAFRFPLEKLKSWAHIFLLINLVLMVLVFLPPFGTSFGGATRWLIIGPFSIQPSELLKFSFLLYLAAWLSKAEKTEIISGIKRTWKSKGKFNLFKIAKEFFQQIFSIAGLREKLLPFLGIVGIVGLFLVIQPDISTLGIISFTALAVYFAAGAPFSHILITSGLGMGILSLLIKYEPYRFNRILVFLHPETDPMGIGYQMKQAIIAVGSGGLTGLGLGMSIQKTGFLPQPMSDAIFAIFSEETGFVGAAVLILLFLVFFWQTLKVADNAPDKFLQLLALGIGIWILIQAFMNIGANLRALPLMGIPLPFMSYGGSAIISELAALGILLNISKYIKNQ
ncbi:MAG: putative peptidoglycan glycosyltransferase FtsW [Candidatus Parcubacteria bacterium]|nr:putative peptidoglycan glycosyltransferase FtsW [Candidatus Parcubacteria bacterium]